MSGQRHKPLPPMHPGEMLREEFVVPLGLSSGRVAKAIGVPRTRVERIIREEPGISADTALRLGKAFGTTPEFWINLQTRHDILAARASIAQQLEAVVPLVDAA